MLLKMLAGIEAPSGGQVRIGGRDLALLANAARAQADRLPAAAVSSRIGISTVADLVRLGAERTGDGVVAAAEQAIATSS